MPHLESVYSYRLHWLQHQDSVAMTQCHWYMNWRGPNLEWCRLDAEAARQVVDRALTRIVLLNGERLQEHKLVFVVFEDVEVVTSESEAEVPE